MDESTRDPEDEEGGAGINLEIVRSYAAFAVRAIRGHRLLVVAVAMAGIVITGLLVRYLPRTYSCTTVMMTVANAVLDSDRGPQPLAGAENLIMRHENLESIINDTGLRKHYFERRPKLLYVKDSLIKAAFGPMDDKTLTAVLVGTLESRLSAEVEKDTLAITVQWSDAATTAELAEATKQRFLRMRHTAEISAFQEKMAILDSHAGKMREEIDVLAEQLKASLLAKAEEKAAELRKSGATSATLGSSPVVSRLMARKREVVTDEQLPRARERLSALKQKLGTVESERNARMREEQSKLDDLKLRLTPNHPQVITQEERVGMSSQVPSELALMRSEVADLESQIRQRDAMVKTGRVGGGGGGVRVGGGDSATPSADPLPSDILELLDEKDADPALSAQMSGAVVRYGSLRDDVRGAKLALDTAQAAFNHRYQVVIPVEAPDKPIKPNVGIILGVGIVLSLLLSLLLPIMLQLRQDVLVERWQVDHFQLPVLAELRLPEKSQD